MSSNRESFRSRQSRVQQLNSTKTALDLANLESSCQYYDRLLPKVGYEGIVDIPSKPFEQLSHARTSQ